MDAQDNTPGHSRNRIPLSAAQPQPNDRGEITAFVAGLALCRAALNGATSSPVGRYNVGMGACTV